MAEHSVPCQHCQNINDTFYNNHVDCLRSWHSALKNYFWKYFDMQSICVSASYLCMVYAHENGCPWYDKAIYDILKKDYDSHNIYLCMTYALDQGVPLPPESAVLAARHGHVDCFKLAITNGCPFEVPDLYVPWLNGDLRILRSAFESLSFSWEEVAQHILDNWGVFTDLSGLETIWITCSSASVKPAKRH